MSDFGLFDSIETNENEQRIATRESTQVIDRAIHDVSERFGRMLAKATSREDFNDRVALVKNDMMKIVSEHLMPKPAVMRQVVASQKPDFGTKKAWDNTFSDDPQNHQHGLSDEQLEQEWLDDQDGTRDLHERGPMASKQAGMLDHLENALSTSLGNGWTTFVNGAGDQVLYREFSDYDGGRVVVPTDGSNLWEWQITVGLRNVLDRGVANSPEEAMSAVNERYMSHKNAAKHADTKVDPQHLPDHFDDEGSVTDLDDAGRDTAPRDASRKEAEQGKALIPSKDWGKYLRDRAADGKKVRDHNFTKGSSVKTANRFEDEGYNAFLRGEMAAPGMNAVVMQALEGLPVGDPLGTSTMESFSRGYERAREEQIQRDFPEMYASKKTAAQLEWYGEGNDYQTFWGDDNPPPGPQGYVGIDMQGVWYGYIYDAYANEDVWEGSGFGNAHDAINAVDAKLLSLGTFVANKTASDDDENLIAARITARKYEAQEDPKEVNPEPSGSDAYHRSEDMETLDPDKVETQPKDASRKTAGRMDTIRSIVNNQWAEEIDGMLVDLQTANLVLKCYDAGNDKTKGLLETAPLEKVVSVCWKMTASRKEAWSNFGGGLGGGYEFNVTDSRDGADGFGIWKWEILKGYRDEDVVMSGVVPQDQMDRYEIREFVEEQFVNYMRTAKRKKADTKVDPQPLPSDFDDEGGRTQLDPPPEDTAPRDAALAAKWHASKDKGMTLPDFAAFHDITAATAKRVARLPFDGGHQTVADAADAYAASPLVDDVEDLDHHVPVIEHFSNKTASPNYVDNVGVSPSDWDTWGEDQLFGPDSQYDYWVSNYYGGEHTVDALEDYISNGVGTFAPEGLDAIRRHWNDRYSSRTAGVKTAGWQEHNWRTYGVGNASYAPDHETGDVVADYVDGLYPADNPSAVVVDDDGEMTVEVFDGFGGLVDTKVFYDINESIAWASKILQKAYKGEARGDKGQGKFFTTPGVGKLFGSRTAASISPADVKQQGEGWYMYEPSGGAQLTVTDRGGDSWEIEVAFPDGRYEETTVNSWNDVDAVQAGVDFYNRTASRVATKRTASSPVPRAASGGIHRVAGWDWDQRQSAYIAQAGQDTFDCTCGRKVATPSFKTCECGTIWNSYHIETAAGRKTMCREVPSRDALLASRS